MHFGGEGLDALAQVLGYFRERSILPHQFDKLRGLLSGQSLPLGAGDRQGFAVLGIRLGMCLVAVGLAGLREKDKGRRIGRLKAKRQVEEDERIDVETKEAGYIRADPECDDQRLSDQENRGAEEACKSLRLERKPIVPEDLIEMHVREVKPEVMICGRVGSGWRGSKVLSLHSCA